MLRPAELDRADVDVIRKEVFSTSTFYVTSITQARQSLQLFLDYLSNRACKQLSCGSLALPDAGLCTALSGKRGYRIMTGTALLCW